MNKFTENLKLLRFIRLITVRNHQSYFTDDYAEETLGDALKQGWKNSVFQFIRELWDRPEIFQETSDRKILVSSVCKAIVGSRLESFSYHRNDNDVAVYYMDNGEKIPVPYKRSGSSITLLDSIPYGVEFNISVRRGSDLPVKFTDRENNYGSKTLQSSSRTKGYSDPYPGSGKPRRSRASGKS